MADAHTQAERASPADTRRREFWQTLLALGFDPGSACTGAYSGVRLDAHVFATGIYHSRASELLLHFLLTQLDAARARREFADCWPIGGARQARDFRAHAFRWLDELRRASLERGGGGGEEERWPADVPVRRSDVDEGRGLRFEQALWALAPLAARHVLRGPWRAFHGHHVDGGQRDAAALLRRCRERYARRTRDRQQAQNAWRATHGELSAQLAEARAGRLAAYEEYRASRRRVRSIAQAPPADAEAAEVAGALARRAEEARELWRAGAGWIEERGALLRAVGDVVGRRANGVRLDGRRHVRLVPPPAMAQEWARWMAEAGVRPFRGANVDLHAVARMAAACIGALRGSLGGSLGAEPAALHVRAGGELSHAVRGPLPGVSAAAVAAADGDVCAAEARVERLRRLRARLLAQRAEVCCALRAGRAAATAAAGPSAASAGASAAAAGGDGDGDALPLPLPRSRGSGCTPARLADAWDALLMPQQGADAADDGCASFMHAAGPTPGLARMSLALSSSSSSTTHTTRTTAAYRVDLGAKRRSISREMDEMALDDRAADELDMAPPDFLVG
ncbi:hypothetical protein LPJ53_002699 [Coemansia erecta]|uniref:HAUS augmin-like complex subunit 6 N-terminal domain-containing protein n=1 Tax=Coemansia erecta TaxID=147472 RepID=A0A9W7Y0W5_9FUNG|nr:hypothetical protein LPJ53_002699 [Coemansia erecta]